MSRSNRQLAACGAALALACVAGCTPGAQERVIPAAMGSGGGALPPPAATVPAPRVAFLGEIGAPGLLSPTRVAVGAGGELLVSDASGRGVHVFSPRGTPRARLGGFLRPLAVGAGPGGTIYVGDAGDGSVRIVDRTGRELGRFGAGAGELAMPNDLAVDAATGEVYVSDSRRDQVRVFSAGGTPVRALLVKGAAPGQVSFPTGILVDGDGILLADHGNNRVQSFSRSGEVGPAVFGGQLSAAPGGLVRPQGIARDGLGRVYVADAFRGTVQVFDPGGASLGFVGDPGTGQGKLVLPSDVALDAFGRLLVASYDTGKVLVYGIDDWVMPPPDLVSAVVTIEPRTLNVASRGGSVAVSVEVPGHHPSEIVADEVALLVADHRVAPELRHRRVGDRDGDGVPELALRFSRPAVVAALGAAGRHEVVLSASLASGELVEGRAEVVLVGPPRGAGDRPRRDEP